MVLGRPRLLHMTLGACCARGCRASRGRAGQGPASLEPQGPRAGNACSCFPRAFNPSPSHPSSARPLRRRPLLGSSRLLSPAQMRLYFPCGERCQAPGCPGLAGLREGGLGRRQWSWGSRSHSRHRGTWIRPAHSAFPLQQRLGAGVGGPHRAHLLSPASGPSTGPRPACGAAHHSLCPQEPAYTR